MAEYVRLPLRFRLSLGQEWTPEHATVLQEAAVVEVNGKDRDSRVACVVAALDVAYEKLKAHYLRNISTQAYAP